MVRTCVSGRTRLEPVGIIIVSVVMSLAALQLIVESIQKIVEFSKGTASVPVVDLWTFIIAGSTIGTCHSPYYDYLTFSVLQGSSLNGTKCV